MLTVKRNTLAICGSVEWGEDMSEEILLRNCAPTLAGLKTGNIFGCVYADEEALRESLRGWNRRLLQKGLRVVPLQYCGKRALLYVYRPARLADDLRQTAAAAVLSPRGYCPEKPERCVVQLMQRLAEKGDFPHEIGLFIGYPPHDVRAFIENGAKNCKCVGCWKVYGDVEAAKRQFARFKKCTAVYCDKHKKGRTVEQLTVSERKKMMPYS